MKLNPTDWGILKYCSQNRETPANLGALLDKDPSYISGRIRHLTELDLIEPVGPAERSAMYVTSEFGDYVLSKQDKYDKSLSDTFGAINNIVSNQADAHNINRDDVILATNDALDILNSGKDMLTPEWVSDYTGDEFGLKNFAPTHLYELWFFDCVENQPLASEHPVTEKGRKIRAADVGDINELHDNLSNN